jgi:hypothetical protein
LKKTLLPLLFSASLYGTDAGYEPLYAGTQLAFYPYNAEPGRLSFQPFIIYLNNTGFYTRKWRHPSQPSINTIAALLSFETGITHWLDITLDLTGATRQFKNQHSWVFGDTAIYLGFQLSHEEKNSWIPDCRLILGETFPTGKYDRLNPQKSGSDIFGAGSYTTALLLVLAKTFYTLPSHPVNLNLNVYYLYPSPAHIHGLSFFGGTPHTRGTAHPGTGFITNLAIEYSFNINWALGMDMRYVHQNKSVLKGNAPQTQPSSEQFSLAPCLEYSWSTDFSTALGPWLTIAGRNSPAFVGFITNIYVYF